ILTLLVAVILLALPIFASESSEKSSANEQGKKYETLDEALTVGKPVLCLFHTSKACRCTMKKCKAALATCDSIAYSLPDDVIYFKVDIALHKSAAKTHKIMAAPTIVFFDKNRLETSRLQSWQIKREAIEQGVMEITKKEQK
ncbi:hypothetical protein DRQ33_07410, partial [bacterium]